MSEDVSTDAAVIRWFEWWEEQGRVPRIDKKNMCMVLAIEECSWWGTPRDNLTSRFQQAVLQGDDIYEGEQDG